MVGIVCRLYNERKKLNQGKASRFERSIGTTTFKGTNTWARNNHFLAFSLYNWKF
jgi:hypothetical protein